MKIEKLGNDSDTIAQIDDITGKINDLVEQVNRQEEALVWISEYSAVPGVIDEIKNILNPSEADDFDTGSYFRGPKQL